MGRVVSVNVGAPRAVEWGGRTVVSAIWKSPVAGRLPVRGVNVAGDDQADRRVHGGTHKAVYAYAGEDLRWWSDELGRVLAPGTFGENLTTEDVDVGGAVVGERWQVGTTLLEVSEPRIPCGKLGMRMGDERFPRRFAAAGRPGAYLRIVREGEVGAGDAVEVLSRPSHGLRVADVAAAYHDGDPALVRALVDVPQLSESWRSWARRARVRPARGG